MDVLMPQLGETVAEGKISAWFKSVGDRVAAGDNLFEVETDKTAMEVPTTGAGVVAEIRVAAGETVPVGTVVAVIAGDGAAVTVAAPSSKPAVAPAPRAPSAPSAAPAVLAPIVPAGRASVPFDPFNEVRLPGRNYGPARLPSGVPITPLARRLAAESGIDLTRLSGSGPHGRIVARDVEGARPTSPLLARPATSAPAPFELVPHDAARRDNALAIAAAKRAVPHFVVRRDVVLDGVLKLISEIEAADPSLAISLVHCVAKALAIALTKVPEANIQWSDDHMRRFRQVDIAVAAAAGEAATIRAAERVGVAAMARELREARITAPEGVAMVWDMSGAGVRAVSATVRPPHTMALTIGAIEKRAVVAADRIAVATQTTLCLACDHRAIDGALGARLLAACAAALERPLALIL
ncbi:MAG: 2-oxo acid dehydrogenase subunit E2 [Gemmatimonas sp.]